jgi:tetratricopeptide (TPR) repeat protein
VNYIKTVEPRAALIPLPYAGHKCIQVAAGADRISSILDLTTGNRVSDLLALGRRLRATSPARYSNLAILAIPRRPALAERIMAAAPVFVPLPLIAEFRMALAEHFLSQGEYLRALEASSVAASMQPDDPNTHRQVGKVCTTMRLWQPAIAAYERVIAISKEDVPTLITLAHLAHHAGDRVISEGYLTRAERIDPNHPRYVSGSNQLCTAWGR